MRRAITQGWISLLLLVLTIGSRAQSDRLTDTHLMRQSPEALPPQTIAFMTLNMDTFNRDGQAALNRLIGVGQPWASVFALPTENILDAVTSLVASEMLRGRLRTSSITNIYYPYSEL